MIDDDDDDDDDGDDDDDDRRRRTGQGGVSYRLLSFVIFETRLNLSSSPLFHLRVPVWI